MRLARKCAVWLAFAAAVQACRGEGSSTNPVTPAAGAGEGASAGVGAVAGAGLGGAGVGTDTGFAGGSAGADGAAAGSGGTTAGTTGAAGNATAGMPAAESGAGGTSAGTGVAGMSGTGGEAGASAGAGAGAGGGSGAAGAASPSFPSVSDLGGKGPFQSMTVNNTGPGNGYTIYRPTELAPGGAKNPIVGWMSGGATTPSLYTLLPRLAEFGFVIVASNTVPAIGAEVALGEEIIAGIDWILGENAKSGSPYFEKVDATKIASMGYSMGALATTTIADDPRLTTTVHISGGNMMIDRIKLLHAPAAFLCGASGVDIAGANCATDFEAATVPVFYGVFNGGDHLGVLLEPYADRIRIAVTGWLRWQLMGDSVHQAMFVGDQCKLCTDNNWTVKQKNLN